jgi:hypothetical protein
MLARLDVLLVTLGHYAVAPGRAKPSRELEFKRPLRDEGIVD